MNIETATYIAHMTCRETPRLMDAIKALRNETSMGLFEAKNYLTDHGSAGEEILLKKLSEDFVESKADLIIQVKREIKRLTLYLGQLEFEVEEEKKNE